MDHDALLPSPIAPHVCTSSWASCVAMVFALRWVTVSLAPLSALTYLTVYVLTTYSEV